MLPSCRQSLSPAAIKIRAGRPFSPQMFSPAHQRRSPLAVSCPEPASSIDPRSTRLPRETQRKTMNLNETQRFSMICTDELAGRPTAEKGKKVEDADRHAGCDHATNRQRATGKHDKRARRDQTPLGTPGGVVGGAVRETVPAVLFLPLVPGQTPCETIPALTGKHSSRHVGRGGT